MSEATIKQVVEEYLNSNWSSTEIAWENVEPRDPGSSTGAMLYDGSDPYISVAVEVSETKAITVPVACKRYYGQIYVDIHVPEGTGSRQAATFLDSLNNLLQYKTLANGVRVKNYVRVGESYKLREGWVMYSALWFIEAEFT